MSLRQTVDLAICAVDREALHSLHALKIRKASQGYTRGPCCETEHLRALVTVERLECSPPPDDDRIRAGVTMVLCSTSPLVNVDVRRSRNQELHFLLVELEKNVNDAHLYVPIRLTIEISSLGMIS